MILAGLSVVMIRTKTPMIPSIYGERPFMNVLAQNPIAFQVGRNTDGMVKVLLKGSEN